MNLSCHFVAKFFQLCTLFCIGITQTVFAAENGIEQAVAVPKGAILVANRLGDEFTDQSLVFESLLVSEITSQGFMMISATDTLSSVQSMTDPSQASDASDSVLRSSSATRLAQSMGADFVLIATLANLSSSQRRITREDIGIDRLINDYELLVTYRFVDAWSGSAFSSGSVTASRRFQQSESLKVQADFFSQLMNEAARGIASKIESGGGLAALDNLSKPEAASASFYLSCSMQDMTVPEVVMDDGELILTGNRYQLEALTVTVEVDGIVVGSAPAEFSVTPGIHNLRLSREGFETWERTVNIRDGQTLNVALTLSEEGRKKWFEMANFFAQLKERERMSRAEQEALEGFAEMIRESGIKINVSSDDSFW